ncbi:hypothetical protein KI688_002701 [Linnemannia hyalina]|uniref:Vacuole protein n=1 Tax=Linnemannia hyalina TaxID=64524 RepID=A0A9P7XQN9_9FUNG|nr:hypothetical protein KI688_002701 [Linnemannia hyalina]
MGAHWKREKVQDHKFDFINVDDFIDNSCWRQFRYMMVFLIIIRGILVYCSDIFTAVNLWTNKNPTSFIKPNRDGQLDLGIGGIKLSMEVYKYLFTGCIVLGLLLLALDIRRANGIIASRDISYAFTSQIAARYYTVRSYPHYCFFAEIDSSKKFVDNVAFFVFFTFRNWKRLLLADAPRQLINMTMLYQVFKDHFDSTFFEWNSYIGSEDSDLFKKIALGAMMFTVTVFVFNMLSFIAAVCMYIPLVSHIQGNLKEYCCYKIDKRIEELIKKNTKNRANAAKSKGGKDIALDYMGKPTLPQVDIIDSAPSPAAPPPRNPYNKGGYGHQQQDYDYGYSTQPSGGYNPSPQQAGYTQNYGNEDYFQAKPVYNNSSSKGNYQQQRGGGGGGKGDGGFDPYAESAFTTEDAYDQHSGTGSQDQLHSQKSRDNHYNAAQTPRGGGNSGGSGVKYDDYSHLRSASPLPSQHGSDLDSNHYSNHSGTGYNNSNTNNGGYYRNDSYSTTHGNNGSGGGGGTPQRPRRNDQSSNYRNY